MDRRTFTSAAAAGFVGLPFAAVGQPRGKAWRVGFLVKGTRSPDGKVPAPLRTALQSLGYVEGDDITYEGRWAELRTERLGLLAAERVALKPNVMVVLGGDAAAAAQKATSTVRLLL